MHGTSGWQSSMSPYKAICILCITVTPLATVCKLHYHHIHVYFALTLVFNALSSTFLSIKSNAYMALPFERCLVCLVISAISWQEKTFPEMVSDHSLTIVNYVLCICLCRGCDKACVERAWRVSSKAAMAQRYFYTGKLWLQFLRVVGRGKLTGNEQ